MTDADFSEAKSALRAAEEVDAARTNLQVAIQSRRVPDLLAAILEGKKVGLQDEDLSEARKLLGAEERRASARKRLEAAAGRRDIMLLQGALKEGRASGLPAGDLQEAASTLALLEEQHSAGILSHEPSGLPLRDASVKREPLYPGGAINADHVSARQLLFEALAAERRSAKDLLAAIRAGKAAGLPDDAFWEARTALGAETNREAARKSLARACDGGGVSLLRSAIREGVLAGLPGGELQAARARLADEEERSGRASES